jgi:hypothetical protein
MFVVLVMDYDSNIDKKFNAANYTRGSSGKRSTGGPIVSTGFGFRNLYATNASSANSR